MELLTRDFPAASGFSVGHWTDREAQTGSTVILFDDPTLTAVDVRGAAPGSRELDLLRPGMTVQRPNAILLTGGSSLGLQAAEGVVQWLQEHDRGFPTSAGPVPIVPAAVIFDLAVGKPIPPDRHGGYEACTNAVTTDYLSSGQVGAGTGATVGKLGGAHNAAASGFGVAQIVIDEGSVFAFVVVNALGAPVKTDESDPRIVFLDTPVSPPSMGRATTLMSCVTDIPLDHESLIRLTVAMHDGLARCIAPVHTIADGDIAFASTLRGTTDLNRGSILRASVATELAVEAAIRTVTKTT